MILFVRSGTDEPIEVTSFFNHRGLRFWFDEKEYRLGNWRNGNDWYSYHDDMGVELLWGESEWAKNENTFFLGGKL